MIQFLGRFGEALKAWLDRPGRVLGACLVFAILQLLIQGNLFHLLRLHSDRESLAAHIISNGQELIRLQTEIRRAKDTNFIEREAKDRLDMAGEDELVFVFSSD